MIWILGIIGAWLVFSAALFLILCIFSSRLSEAEGREEVWARTPERVTYRVGSAREAA